MKKVKKHEPQAVKEDPKKIARRNRAKARRERKAREEMASKKAPRLVKRVKTPETDGNKSSVVSKIDISVEEEAFLKLEDLNRMISPDLPFVKFCSSHYSGLITCLKSHDLVPWMAVDLTDLQEKFKNKEIEPLFQAFDALIRLSIKALGAEVLKKYHCPVCAFEENDYLDQVASAMRILIQERTRG